MKPVMMSAAMAAVLWGCAAVGSQTFDEVCDCDVSDVTRETYDRLLRLWPDEEAEALATHCPWGVPESLAGGTNERLLFQEHHIINYDADLRVPLWAAYRLTWEDIVDRERVECFRRDVRIVDDDEAAFCDDYEEPIHDRGHLVPSADMARTEAAMINTYLFTNMLPQHANFNRRTWKFLEEYVRDAAETWGTVHVVTGAIFDRDGDGERDEDSDALRMRSNSGDERVAVPTHFYKILLYEFEEFDDPEDAFDVLTVLLPHDDVPRRKSECFDLFEESLTSVDAVEALAGVDLFPDMEDSVEEATERFVPSELWEID